MESVGLRGAGRSSGGALFGALGGERVRWSAAREEVLELFRHGTNTASLVPAITDAANRGLLTAPKPTPYCHALSLRPSSPAGRYRAVAG